MVENAASEAQTVIVRQYHHPDDLTTIQKMFVDATMTGRESLILLRNFLRVLTPYPWLTANSPYQCGMTMYNGARIINPSIGAAVALHLMVLFPPQLNSRIVHLMDIGICILCLLGSIYMWYKRRHVARLFQVFLDVGLAGELSDIVKYFDLHVRENGVCTPSGPSGFWVAEISGEIVGCVGLNKNRNPDPSVGDVRRLLVDPSHQGRGVAQHLMTAVVSHARQHNLEALELTTSDYNLSALRFYKRIGWNITGRTNFHGFQIAVLRQELIEHHQSGAFDPSSTSVIAKSQISIP
ncbi:hypothetical protein H0H93_002149 [Arthromyces matolae]|nr:hypothetical protein H0H93_002149 [Arthromyces matolae]